MRSQLPPFFCLDLLFKYKLFDLACEFLFNRREFNELLQMIRFEYNENKQQAEAFKSKIAKLKASEDSQSLA